MKTGSYLPWRCTRLTLAVLAAACLAVWSVAFPAARAEAKPARYVPVGAVNVAALKLAVADTIRTYGPRYPKGPQYLKRLAELEARQKVVNDGSPEQMQEFHDASTALRREIMLDHPLLDFDRLLFVKRMTYGSSHIYSDFNDGSRTMGGNLCILSPVGPEGKVTEIAPELNGGLFGRFDLSFDAKKVVFAYKKDPTTPYRIHEIGVDGKGLRQLTFEGDDEADTIRRYGGSCHGRGYDDLDPCYLPNGKIMFASTRSKWSVFCFPISATALHVMDADGKDIRKLSGSPLTELAPCVMNDGRVIYMRWEYVDKGFGNVQSLWSMHPDGSHSAHVYKNDVALPAGMVDPRSIPGSELIVTVGAPHCTLAVGPVVLVDNRTDRRTGKAMTNITPEIGYPSMFPAKRSIGFFKEPYPFSEKFFLVSHNPGIKRKRGTGYGIYALDAWGNRAELYRDPEISCFQPIPLRPRRRPTEIASVETDDMKDEELATLFMQDVYQGMTGIERGRVKYVRVMEAIGVSWDAAFRSGRQGDGAGLQSSAVSSKGDVHLKKIHGIATVHEDGSAFFTMPAEKNLFFQALDENYMELQRMRTFVNLMPGERRSCIGCHELRRKAPDMRLGRPRAMDYPAQALRPQPGDDSPRMVHYALDVQPLLDEHCVGCHGGKGPKGDLDLTGGLTKLWNRSYENLEKKRLISHLNGGYGNANVRNTPPLAFGSHRSKLVERIRKDPCKAKLTGEEFIRIVTWIDANAPYYGTHRGKKNLKWKDEPDFRPLPLAGKQAARPAISRGNAFTPSLLPTPAPAPRGSRE